MKLNWEKLIERLYLQTLDSVVLGDSLHTVHLKKGDPGNIKADGRSSLGHHWLQENDLLINTWHVMTFSFHHGRGKWILLSLKGILCLLSYNNVNYIFVTQKHLSVTFYTLTSVYMFSILLSFYFPFYWQGEFVEQSRAHLELISSFDLTVILKEITFWSLLRIKGSREDFLVFCFVFLFNDCVKFSTKRNYWSETHLHHDTSVCYQISRTYIPLAYWLSFFCSN